jgi:uncharacterized lipoprotein YddW (UPF0748 family)
MRAMLRANRLMLATVAIAAVVAYATGSFAAENLAPNPTAEQVDADGKPTGWGLYLGAGQAKLRSTTDQKHSGQRSTCLELTDWHTPAGADGAAHRSASSAIVLAPNNGYNAAGALACSPGESYTLSFWYKGDVASATVSAVGWPSPEATDSQRIPIPISEGEASPGAQWRRWGGRFRIPERARRFALMIHVAGEQSKGFQFGKLYVDDIAIMPHAYPDGELRAMWCALPSSPRREDGLREIEASLDKAQSGGFNTLFVWTLSRYLAALDRPELQTAEPQARWDVLGELIRAAKTRGIQVHMWYAPWGYKSQGAIELAEHPQWAAVDAKGVPDPDGVCLIRPEVRQFELDLLAMVIDRYSDLAGIHIEEPGFNWGQSCCCDYCREFCRKTLGVDPRENLPDAKAATAALPAFMCTNFFIRLRQLMFSKRPEMWLSANGCGGDNSDWPLGRDWPTWARRGYIDFYVPQLYTGKVEKFTADALTTQSLLGGCDLVTGMAVSWSGISPRKESPAVIKAEIAAARKLGAKGFSIYHQSFFENVYYLAVREAVQKENSAAGSK